MHLLLWQDYAILLAYLAFSLAIGLYYRKRASGNLQEFFLGGRSVPGWLAGLSMVATTFAADTPLAVTELVRSGGVAGNWIWWSMLAGGMFTTVFFARLWRRTGIATDLELLTLRYCGAPALWLRKLKAVYIGGVLNSIIIAWVNLAMLSILQVFLGLGYWQALGVTAAIMLLTTFYTSLSGIWGVVVTDAFQFILAMGGCIVLAIIVLQQPEIGGLAGLASQLPPQSLRFLPQIGDTTAAGPALPLGAFLTMILVQWWAAWYPGAEPGGGGYVAQRMLSARTEGEAQQATFLFQVLHYAVRPWPWILVGLACLVLYPQLSGADAKLGYLYAMRDFLPAGLRGLLLAAFLAAYMSTIATQLNWGGSYLVNDFWLQLRRSGTSTDKQQVRLAQVAQGLLMVLSLAVTTQLDSIKGAWELLLECGAGVGFALIARWFWWRISAWAELVATVLPFALVGLLNVLVQAFQFPPELSYWLVFPGRFLLLTCLTVVGTLLAVYLLPGTQQDTLRNFATKIDPPGWWGPWRNSPYTSSRKLALLWGLLLWLLATASVYGVLFGIGYLLLGSGLSGALLLSGSLALLVWIYVRLGST